MIRACLCSATRLLRSAASEFLPIRRAVHPPRGPVLLMHYLICGKGESLVVWKLDRLGRSVKGLVDLVAEFETRQVHFRSLTDRIDTKTPAGRFFFHVMASLAQMERELIVERTRAGLNAARKIGRTGGRPRRTTPGKVESAKQLLAAGMPPRSRPKSCRVGTNALQMVALVEPFLTRLVSLCWTTLQLGTLFRADDKTLSGRFGHLLRNLAQIVNRHDALHLGQ
jgi:hypothetical protein